MMESDNDLVIFLELSYSRLETFTKFVIPRPPNLTGKLNNSLSKSEQ